MRRSLLLIVFALLLALPVAAQDSGVEITFPPSVYDVEGTVEVRGTVNPPDLQSYFLEAAPYDPAVPDNQKRWIPMSVPARAPVTDGVIATWPTTVLPDGVYQLRLHVVLTSGQRVFSSVGPVRVTNRLERPEDETTVTGVVTVPTEAPEVPTEPPATEAPPEPTIVPRPNPVNELPVPVGGHISGFNEEAIALMQEAGMTWVKWQIPFTVGDTSLIDVARDRINWTHERGMNVFLSIKGNKDELGAMGEEYYPLYAEFVGQVAALRPDAIQVWNEMNLDREWPQGQIDPAMYVDLLRPAYEAIKAVDPEVMVVTGAPAPTGAEGAFGLDRVWNDDRYYLGMANAGAAQYSDCIGVHYNEGIIPPQQQGGDPRGGYPTYYFPLMLQRAAFPFRNIPDTSFCFSELGYLSPEGYGTLPEGFAWAANTSVEEQAAWLRDAILIAAQTDTIDVDLIIVWNVDFSNFDEDPQAGFAIIRPDGTCPACATIGELRDPANANTGAVG